ncbi:MAG: ribonuclease H-like domain-containing protein [Mycobacterium sp.]|nr:ribonuclease H-like domain-containing protein [Mycobacterium sp.]
MAEIFLGGYPAQRCARRTHNDFDPGAPTLGPPDAALQARFDRGLQFQDDVLAAWGRCYDGLLVIDREVGPQVAIAQTVAAMNRGVPVIAAGRLPDVNGRSGAPDALVRCFHGYLPVEIKGHKTLTSPRPGKSKSGVAVSTLADPVDRRDIAGFKADADKRRRDGMQLAHYTRMLQELGHHAGAGDPELLVGGVVGTTDLGELLGDPLGIVWHRLADPLDATGSMLDRYDDEFGFRLQVAAAARRGDELVRPLRIGECNECPWLEHCAQVAGPDDASFALLTGHLNDREWRHLYATAGDGHTLSVAQLAAVEVDGCAADFRAQSIGTRDPRARLGNAVRRASMTLSGTDFEPVGGKWPVIPSADVEVDFDIEWDLDNRIYQWGLRIRDGHDDATARYQPVMSFAPLDDAAEAALADEMADRLTRLRADADRDGKSLKVFHWSPVELTQSARFPRVAAALSGVSVDLMAWFNREFFARGSSSIKAVAPLLGFDWGTEDAGGLTSQLRIEEARGTGPAAEAARAWCLRYNEDDVAAQAAIRDGLRRLGDAPRRT